MNRITYFSLGMDHYFREGELGQFPAKAVESKIVYGSHGEII